MEAAPTSSIDLIQFAVILPMAIERIIKGFTASPCRHVICKSCCTSFEIEMASPRARSASETARDEKEKMFTCCYHQGRRHYPALTCNLLSCLHTTMLLSPRILRVSVLMSFWHSKGTQLRSNDHVLFGVLVCFRHRRALTVHLCHLRSEHSGNVRIKHNLRLPRT